ncbi:MAG: hypothetical protein HOM14_01380 [Gammaproteobacteria bacterium]|jgi:gas vesicle protein|nr:hypothetical protein [Gammaproteobacteria bacterium]MBT3724660.1 hypothetical protein [Gammaproteobacteria bacterium]MBT4078394.1 hypothetical protein [Gammaproteobacteria bacterium]MBT4449262.1 hypothetical protein [Gammaproteobacteria bacterium]MBT4859767.1 hypothetical protein [Gammaproteobacteria bacterium]
MSVINFPINGLLLNMSLVMLISGCAANKPIVVHAIEESPKQDIGHQVSNCRSTQRDLTTTWSLRQYWCTEENRREVLQSTNNQLMDQVAANQSAVDNAYIEDVNNEVNKSQYQYQAPIVDSENSGEPQAPSINREDAIQRLKGIKKSDKLKTVPVSSLTSGDVSLKANKNATSNSIIFAHHLRVLGPQGRAATHALIDQVSSSNNVHIRGLILPDEILVDSNLYREQVSVGRALAVRKYWKAQGLDTSHIMILHNNPELSGRTVEVTFHG